MANEPDIKSEPLCVVECKSFEEGGRYWFDIFVDQVLSARFGPFEEDERDRAISDFWSSLPSGMNLPSKALH